MNDTKRYRHKKAKDNQLRVSYGKLEGSLEVVYSWGDGTSKTDAFTIMEAFACKRPIPSTPMLLQLIERGYDITTIDFKIDKLDLEDKEKVELNEIMKKYLEQRIC